MDLVKYLIDNGADTDFKDKFGQTALVYATDYGKTELIKALMNSSENSNKGNIEIVKYLLLKGADINLKDKDGVTVLMIISSKGDIDLVKYFVSHGADINIQDKKGKTALVHAEDKKRKDIVEYLKKHDAK